MSRKPSEDETADMLSDTWPATATPAHDGATTAHAGTDFDALFLAHYDGVYRLLYRIVGTRDEAEDLAQETFLRLSRQRFGPGREHNVRGWLYAVASNLAFNALRSRGRRQRREKTAFRQGEDSGERDPAEAAMQDDERAAVRRTLATLPERHAQILLLRHAGLSYREIADALGMAFGSVGTTLARAEAAFEAAWRDR
jgi:RNA polymerase sigma-70 factor, ECF subfamily